jgi:hypothetical protein
MKEIKHLKIETATPHISFLNLCACKGTCLTHACIPFFARTDVDAGGATDSLVQSVRWVEPGCRDDRPGLPLTIGSPGLPLYLPYIYIYLVIYMYLLWAYIPGFTMPPPFPTAPRPGIRQRACRPPSPPFPPAVPALPHPVHQMPPPPFARPATPSPPHAWKSPRGEVNRRNLKFTTLNAHLKPVLALELKSSRQDR